MDAWQNTPKNSEDNEKIEQAIDRVVGAHNNDPDSHVNPGQSLQSHKASLVIDHLARSIVGDKLNNIDHVLTHLTINTIVSVATSGSNKILTYVADPDLDEGGNLKFAYFMTGSKAGQLVPLVSNGTYSITVLATDVAGVGAGDQFFLTMMNFGSTPANWNINQASDLGYDGLVAESNNANDYIEYTVPCDRVEIYGVKGYDCGKVNIYVDGVADEVVDLYSEEEAGLVVIYEKTFDSTATRTIKVEVRSDKNSNSQDYYCRINAFDINGVIEFSSVRILTLYHHNLQVADASEFFRYNVIPPNGYKIIGLAFKMSSGAEESPSHTIKFEYSPYGDGASVLISNVNNGEEVETETWWLMAKKDSLWENKIV